MRDWLVIPRKNKHLTHQQIADLVGVKRQYYGMIESGDRTPSVSTAKKIAKILEVDWTLFFDDVSNKMLLNNKTKEVC